jgi:hypothetical protein
MKTTIFWGVVWHTAASIFRVEYGIWYLEVRKGSETARETVGDDGHKMELGKQGQELKN